MLFATPHLPVCELDFGNRCGVNDATASDTSVND